MNQPDGKQRRQTVFRVAAAVVVAVVAVALIVVPNLSHGNGSADFKSVRPEVSTIDPRVLVPALTDLPSGSSVQSATYISNAQASQRNQTSLSFLKGTGREVGFDRDFL